MEVSTVGSEGVRRSALDLEAIDEPLELALENRCALPGSEKRQPFRMLSPVTIRKSQPEALLEVSIGRSVRTSDDDGAPEIGPAAIEIGRSLSKRPREGRNRAPSDGPISTSSDADAPREPARNAERRCGTLLEEAIRMATGRFLVVASLLTIGAFPDGRARAADAATTGVPVPTARSWVVLPEVAIHTFAETGQYYSLGIAVEHNLTRHFALDADFEHATETREDTLDGGYFDIQPSYDVAIHARAQLPLDHAAMSSLFASLGPQVAVGGIYHDLWRAQLGLRVLAAPAWRVLADRGDRRGRRPRRSRRLDRSQDVHGSEVRAASQVGDVTSSIRLGVGYSF